MAYVPIADKSIGDVLPADDWNQLIENNAANPAGLAVARGDLFEGSAATTLRRIAIGASGRLLRARSTGNVYEAPMVTAPTNLNDSSRDDEVMTWGAARTRFLSKRELFVELSGGFTITVGTTVTRTLAESLADYRWVSFVVGENDNDIRETQRVQESLLLAPPTDFTLYALETDGNLYSVDLVAQTATQLFDLGTGNWYALATHNGALYALQSDGDLYSVDLVAQTATQLFDLGTGSTWYALATHNGALYALQSDGDLYSVDLVAQTATQLFDLGASNSWFALTTHNGALYAMPNNGDLYSVDLVAQTATQLFDLGTGSTWFELTTHNGALYAMQNDGDLYSVDLVAQTATQLFDLGTGSTWYALATHTSASQSARVSDYFIAERPSNTSLRIIPARNGYVHEIVGIL